MEETKSKLEDKKQPDETVFTTNKEKTGEGRKLEKVGTLGGMIWEEKTPPEETIFEDSEVEEIGKGKYAIEGMIDKKKEQKKAGDMDVIFKIENRTKLLQPREVQKKLEKEKLNKPDETVYKANKVKMDQDKMF